MKPIKWSLDGCLNAYGRVKGCDYYQVMLVVPNIKYGIIRRIGQYFSKSVFPSERDTGRMLIGSDYLSINK